MLRKQKVRLHKDPYAQRRRKGIKVHADTPRFRRRNRGAIPDAAAPAQVEEADIYDYSIDPSVCEAVLRRDGEKCVLCRIDDSMEDNRLETILVAWNNQPLGTHTAMVSFDLFFLCQWLFSMRLPFLESSVDLLGFAVRVLF